MATRLYKAGSAATDTPGDVIQLAVNLTESQYMTAEAPVGTDYPVTAGKTLYITKLIWKSDGAGATFGIGYGDDGVAAGASAPTTPVNRTSSLVFACAAADTTYSEDVFIPIPAEKYPYIYTSGTAGRTQVVLLCLEV